MRTAIVILNWNGLHWMQRFLPLVAERSPGARLIVADNGSSDDSVAWLKAAMPTVEVIQWSETSASRGGYNEALAQVKAERYLLLNSDVEPMPHWLEKLGAYLDANPRMAACQPKVLAHADPSRFEHAGAAGGYIDRNGYPFCRGRIFEITEVDEGQYDDDGEVFWATGACLLIRAEAFHQAGGFDASFFAHMEEIDLCWRLRRSGWTIGYTSAASVLHVGGGALGYGSPRKTYLNFRNSLLLLVKNLDTPWWWVRILHRMLLDGVAAAKFIAEGHGSHAWQVARAHWSFMARLPSLLPVRRALKRAQRDPKLKGIYRRSIAYDRFILGWKEFAALDPSAFN
ncbi:MAG: glycosyltransferase family 2 protein [Flavobacteriales bacterium]|nr:glycosyltransferase family 2 protein [Flavobacteriales bacterium]